MRKLIGSIVILLILVVLAIQFAGAHMVSGILSKALGIQVDVNHVHLKLHPTEVGIYGIRIHNPSGFQEPLLADIPEIFVRMNVGDLFKKQAHIQNITLHIRQVTFERTAGGKINLKEFLDRAKQQPSAQTKAPPAESQPKKEAPKPSDQAALKAVIDEASVTIGNLNYVDTSGAQKVVKAIDLKIDHLVIRHPENILSLTEQIIFEILKKVGLSTLGAQADLVLGNLSGQAKEVLGKAKEALSGFLKS